MLLKCKGSPRHDTLKLWGSSYSMTGVIATLETKDGRERA